MGRPLAGMFSDQVMVTWVAEFAAGATLAGAAGMAGVTTCTAADMGERSPPVSTACVA